MGYSRLFGFSNRFAHSISIDFTSRSYVYQDMLCSVVTSAPMVSSLAPFFVKFHNF